MFLTLFIFISLCAPVVCMENYVADKNTLVVTIKKCDRCCKSETFERFKKCSKCENVSYCSVDCQKQDWTTRHKQECGKECNRKLRDFQIEELRVQAKKEVLTKLVSVAKILPNDATRKKAYDELNKYGDFYRAHLNEQLTGACIKKNDAEFEESALLYKAACDRSYWHTFPDQTTAPILFEFQKLLVHHDIFLSRLLKKEDPDTKEKRRREELSRAARYRQDLETSKSAPLKSKVATSAKLAPQKEELIKQMENGEWDYRKSTDVFISFLKVFEGARAESEKLGVMGYPAEAVKALQRLRLKLIEKIVVVVQGKERFLSFEDVLLIWAYKLMVAVPCVHTSKAHQLATCLNQSEIDRQLVTLFECIQHDVVIKDALDHNVDWLNYEDEDTLQIIRLTVNQDFKQKYIDEKALHALAKSFSTLSALQKIVMIASEERFLLSNIFGALYSAGL